MAKVIKQIAIQNQTTEEEVRHSLEEVIAEARANPDPAIQAQWADCPQEGETPTPEEFLFWTAKRVEGKLYNSEF